MDMEQIWCKMPPFPFCERSILWQ
ncbi:hypothetical protein CCR75_000664 [Bremia lactucae]|uniref:Uncharacterized protein n=1 Tax=Bremia lactucae TaxID=4779 RepID=A0A976FEP4_BRELC|nr:hypothetical protein CCR75_000664 [Bremia lactucae]